MDISRVIQSEKEKGGLLDVLKAVQKEKGFLSKEEIAAVAEAYGRSPSEIYETATFYSMLNVVSPGEHILEVCGSTCCDAQGAGEVMQAVKKELGILPGEITEDGKWSFRRCECLGRCDTAPNMVVDGVLYQNVKPGDVKDIIRKAGN